MGLIIVATQQRLCFHFFIFFFCITIITQTHYVYLCNSFINNRHRFILCNNTIKTRNIAATIQTQLFAGLILQADTFHITYF